MLFTSDEQEKRMKDAVKSIIPFLKGLTFDEAEQVLRSVSVEIKHRVKIS